MEFQRWRLSPYFPSYFWKRASHVIELICYRSFWFVSLHVSKHIPCANFCLQTNRSIKKVKRSIYKKIHPPLTLQSSNHMHPFACQRPSVEDNGNQTMSEFNRVMGISPKEISESSRSTSKMEKKCWDKHLSAVCSCFNCFPYRLG